MLSKSALLREILITLALAALVYGAVSFSVQNAAVTGRSMEPNLGDGERVFINKLAYRFGGQPRRGDIVVFTPPEEVSSSYDYVKRIIGLPGERVKIENGNVYVITAEGEETKLDESAYLSQPTAGSYLSGVIPEEHYFVMGDNRNNSSDSRGGWTVSKADIMGKAWIIVWPPSEWGTAPNHKLRATDAGYVPAA